MPYDGKCEMKLVIDIHGTKTDVDVLVDTGFTAGTGFGLKLPMDFARYTSYTGTGNVRLADGSEVAADSIPNAKIIQIEEHQLEDEVTVPALFMSGPVCVGILFLQKCVLNLDGSNKLTTVEF